MQPEKGRISKGHGSISRRATHSIGYRWLPQGVDWDHTSPARDFKNLHQLHLKKIVSDKENVIRVDVVKKAIRTAYGCDTYSYSVKDNANTHKMH